MGLWIEIHCDRGYKGRHPTDVLRPRCRSHENENPAMMFGTTRSTSLATRLKFLETEAKNRGWVKKKGEWHCPGCKD